MGRSIKSNVSVHRLPFIRVFIFTITNTLGLEAATGGVI